MRTCSFFTNFTSIIMLTISAKPLKDQGPKSKSLCFSPFRFFDAYEEQPSIFISITLANKLQPFANKHQPFIEAQMVIDNESLTVLDSGSTFRKQTIDITGTQINYRSISSVSLQGLRFQCRAIDIEQPFINEPFAFQIYQPNPSLSTINLRTNYHSLFILSS